MGSIFKHCITSSLNEKKMITKFLDNIIHRFLWWITETFPNRTRVISRNGEPYLRRFYLTPRRLDENGEDTEKYMGFGIYLHYFYRGDEDEELHNHPWEKALSFILAGGYNEERRECCRIPGRSDVYSVVIHDIKPRSFNKILANDFHRVVKKPGVPHVWTLFVTGKRVQDWGFWNRKTGQYIPHEEFVNQADQGYNQEN